jgi:NAD(P)-dependent dehydrogenase (short-subunit alcohol dehydrogenase family)
MRLEGKVALITGAARGHAEAIAKRFAKEGALVSICDILPVGELENQVGTDIEKAGGKVLCSQTDVSKEDQVQQLVDHTMAHFGTIDILANVVGVAGPTKDVWDMSLAEWKQTLDINLDSLFLCCKSVLPEMIRKRSGKIINFSSGTGKQPLSHRTPYATSKMGVIGFTRTLAADVGRYNITVNAICPGGHEDRTVELIRARAEYMNKDFDEEGFRRNLTAKNSNQVLAGRWCADEDYVDKGSGPDDAARMAVFLASEDSPNITGQDMNTGGGVMW